MERVEGLAPAEANSDEGRIAKEGFLKYVYLLKSVRFPNRQYVGLSKDPDARLAEHNAGRSPHTSKFAPWRLVAKFWLEDSDKVHEFEKYLKSGSGHAFAKRRFW